MPPEAGFPDMGNLSPEQQLALLRGMTKRTQILHEAQVQQLRLWPFAVDPSLSKAEAAVDFEAARVVFTWCDTDKPAVFRPNRDYKQRLQRLEDSVKFLLGAGWRIAVEMNGTTIFQSGRSERNSRKKAKRKRSRRR